MMCLMMSLPRTSTSTVTHWSPWTTVLGLFVGLGAAGLGIKRTINEHNAWVASEAAREAATEEAGGGDSLENRRPRAPDEGSGDDDTG